MKLDFFDRFSDPYVQTDAGRGVFLSGIVLSIVASQQAENLLDAPLFKQISFGRMQMRDLEKLLSRVPELSKAYHLENAGRVAQLLGTAGDLLLSDKGKDLGVDGNFAFAIAFVNAWRYYKDIFPEEKIAPSESNDLDAKTE